MAEKFPEVIYLHDGQTEITWSDAVEQGACRYVRFDQCKENKTAWKAIDTAPKDRTEILLKSKTGRIASGCWVPVNGDKGCWSWPLIKQEPTQWMELPQ